jgi:hypothetical protein
MSVENSIKSIFISILGSCIGVIAGAFVGVYLKLQGIAILLPMAIGLFIGQAIFKKLLGGKIAKGIYEQTENTVHGHPFKTLFRWIIMFAILAAGFVIFGSKF